MRHLANTLSTLIMVAILLPSTMVITGIAQDPGADIEGGTSSHENSESRSLFFNLENRESAETESILSLPADASVTSATLTVIPGPVKKQGSKGSIDGLTLYPKDPRIDIGADGTIDWAFMGPGYGRAGVQNVFENGSGRVYLGANANNGESSLPPVSKNWSSSFKLPKKAIVEKARLLIRPSFKKDWWNTSWYARYPMDISSANRTIEGPIRVEREFYLGPGAEDRVHELQLTRSQGGIEVPNPFWIVSSSYTKVTIGFDAPTIEKGKTQRYYLYYDNPGADTVAIKPKASPIKTLFINDVPKVITPKDQDGVYLLAPRGIHVADDGRVLVADSDDHRIVILDRVGKLLDQIGTKGKAGTGNLRLNCPRDVIMDGSAHIVVSDTCNQRVQVFDDQGRYLTTIGHTGIAGFDPSSFTFPWGLSVDGQGRLMVSDMGNHRILVFDDAFTPVSTWTIGSTDQFGKDSSHLHGPRGIDFSNRLLVADHFNSRVQVFKDHSDRYADITIGMNHLKSPTDVAVGDDEIYVADDQLNSVSIFDIDGYLRATIDGLNGPEGVTVAPDGDLWISDTGNDRILHRVDARLEIGEGQSLGLPKTMGVELNGQLIQEIPWTAMGTWIEVDLLNGIDRAPSISNCEMDSYHNEMCRYEISLGATDPRPGLGLTMDGLDIRYRFNTSVSLVLSNETIIGEGVGALPVRVSSEDGGWLTLGNITLTLDRSPSILSKELSPAIIFEEAVESPILYLGDVFHDEGPLVYNITDNTIFSGGHAWVRDDGWLMVSLKNASNISGPFNITLVAMDEIGQKSPSLLIEVDVQDIADPPVLNVPRSLDQECTHPLEYVVNATDGDKDILEFYLLEAPEGANISQDGTLTWDPGPQDVGENPMIVGVTDGSLDALGEMMVNVSCSNSPPTIEVEDHATFVIGKLNILPVQVTDVDGDEIGIDLLSHPDGLYYNQELQSISWRPTTGQEGLHPVTIEVKDQYHEVQGMVWLEVVRPRPWVSITDGPQESGPNGLEFLGLAGGIDGPVIRVEARIDYGHWKKVEGSNLWSTVVMISTLTPGIHRLEVRSFDGEYSQIESSHFPVYPKETKASKGPIFALMDDVSVMVSIIVVILIIGGIVLLKRIDGILFCIHRSPEGPTMCVPLGEQKMDVGGMVEAEVAEIEEPPLEVQRNMRCFLCLGRIKSHKDQLECPRCGRIYHQVCAERVRTCPMCGASLVEEGSRP